MQTGCKIQLQQNVKKKQTRQSFDIIKHTDMLQHAPVHTWARVKLNCHYVFHSHMWLMAATMKWRAGKSFGKRKLEFFLFFPGGWKLPRFSLSQWLGCFYQLENLFFFYEPRVSNREHTKLSICHHLCTTRFWSERRKRADDDHFATADYA